MEEEEDDRSGDEGHGLWQQVQTLLKVFIGAVPGSIVNFICEDKIAQAVEDDPWEVKNKWHDKEVVPETVPGRHICEWRKSLLLQRQMRLNRDRLPSHVYR